MIEFKTMETMTLAELRTLVEATEEIRKSVWMMNSPKEKK